MSRCVACGAAVLFVLDAGDGFVALDVELDPTTATVRLDGPSDSGRYLATELGPLEIAALDELERAHLRTVHTCPDGRRPAAPRARDLRQGIDHA